MFLFSEIYWNIPYTWANYFMALQYMYVTFRGRTSKFLWSSSSYSYFYVNTNLVCRFYIKNKLNTTKYSLSSTMFFFFFFFAVYVRTCLGWLENMQVLTRGSYCNSIFTFHNATRREPLAFAYYGEFQRFDKEIAWINNCLKRRYPGSF